MKHTFLLGNGAWCRLVWSLAIGVGLITGRSPAFSAELSSHAYPPLLSAAAAGNSSTPLVSDDGRFVVFVSDAENLTANDGNQYQDVFIRDRENRTTVLLSTNETGLSSRFGNSVAPSISANGKLVAYESEVTSLREDGVATPLLLTNQSVILLDRGSGLIQRVGALDGLPLARVSDDPPATNYCLYKPFSSADPIVTKNGSGVFYRVPGRLQNPPAATGPIKDLLVFLDLVNTTTNLAVTAILSPFNRFLDPGDYLEGATFSSDGAEVVFSTGDKNQFPDDQNDQQDVIVYHRIADSNSLASVALDGISGGNGRSYAPDISDDGRIVTFVSLATNLASNDSNSNADVFLRDLAAETTTLVSSNLTGTTTPDSGNSDAPAISKDGRWIAFFSNASDLVADDPNGAVGDVFLRDNESGVITRISNHPDWQGRLATGAPPPLITSDGSFILYQAPGSGLFLYDRATGTSQLLTDDVIADSPAMSPDGRFVVFSSRTIPGFVGGSDAHRQIYLFDRELNSFELISKRDPGLPLASANEATRFEAGVVATADNLLLARSYATDLGLRADDRQLRLWNLANTSTPFAEDLGDINGTSIDAAKAVNLTASTDGRWLAFDYDEPALASAENNSGWQVVLHDRVTGDNRVLNQTGNEYPGPHFPTIAPDASRVVWRPAEGWLTVYEPGNSDAITFSSGGFAGGYAATEAPVFSPDSRFVYFRERGALYELSPDPIPNFRLIRLDTSDLSLSHVDALDLNSGSENVGRFRLSPNGGFAVYETLDPFNGTNVFLNSPATIADSLVASNAFNPFVDNSGNWVAFDSTAPTAGLVDTNNSADVFISNRTSGETALVSINRDGTGTGNGRSRLLGLSADGRFVLFHSWAADLVANDTNLLGDLFLRDLRTQTTLMLTVGLNLSSADGNSSARAMFNRAGTKIVFESYAADLVAGDFNKARDVYTATLSLPDKDDDGLPDNWELTWFGTLAREGTDDFDNDGVIDRDEFVAGTSPVNNVSVLEALTVRSNGSGLPEILWAAVPGRTYRVQYKDDFNVAGWSELTGDVVAGSSTGMRLDDSGTAGERRFYRVLILP